MGLAGRVLRGLPERRHRTAQGRLAPGVHGGPGPVRLAQGGRPLGGVLRGAGAGSRAESTSGPGRAQPWRSLLPGLAAAHPDETLAVYLDNGVCDFKSWPGGKPRGLGIGVGSPQEWAKLLGAFGFQDDREAIAYGGNPVDRLKPLAEANIPILLVYGDSDRTVPHRENSEVVYERYKALGGDVERVVKPGADHHPHGLSDPRPVVEFFDQAWRNRGMEAGAK